jgi:alpha-galactosidase
VVACSVLAALPVAAGRRHTLDSPGWTDAGTAATSGCGGQCHAMVPQFVLVLLLLASHGSAAAAAAPTPGGPFGLALAPPMGWRSWNAYHNSVTQSKMEAVMEAMVAKQPDGESLLSLGYMSAGLDDEWQACGKGFDGSFHDAAGNPMWNHTTFPDPAGMVAKAHSLGLKAGWYMNNCDCKETGLDPTFVDKVYRMSVKMLADQKWDGVKLDGCSQFHNTTYWSSLMKATGRPMTVENCNNMQAPSANPDDPLFPGGVCPYNWFRTSTDINPSWASIMNNLASTVVYQNLTHPLSKPGCWVCKICVLITLLRGDIAPPCV